MKSALVIFSIGLAFGLGWLARGWTATPDLAVYEVVAVRRDTIRGDSVPYPVPVPAPAPRYVTLPPDTVLIAADTAAILAEYLATRYYADTLLNDASALIALREVVTRNRIAERRLDFQNRRPTYVTATTVVQPTPSGVQLSAGAMLGKGMAAPMVQVDWKRWRIGAGYNIIGGGAGAIHIQVLRTCGNR